jgi:hypothetical protein
MHTTKQTSPQRSLLPFWRWIALLCLVLGSVTVSAASAPAVTAPIVLYDGAKNNRPDQQGWRYLEAGGSTTPIFSGGATTLDTSSSKGISAGYFAAKGGFFGSSAPVPALDRAIGYTVSFTVQVELEDHAGSDKNNDGTDDRAGFSLIVISSDKRGIELGFWADRVWAQEGGSAVPPAGTLFTQAEHAPFDTQSARTPYALAIQGETYTLSSNDTPILSGKLRDYSAFVGLTDPYETPNLIFLGDDTSSASAKIQLAYVAVGPSLDRRMYVPLLMRL